LVRFELELAADEGRLRRAGRTIIIGGAA